MKSRTAERPTDPDSVRLKLVVRQGDDAEQDDDQLDILPPPNPEGIQSHDEHETEVSEFLSKYFRYSKPFVSVAVLDESDNLMDFRQRANFYGPYVYVLHNEIIIPKLEIVCSDDIQNAIINALERNAIDACCQEFIDLVKLPDNESKIRALQKAVVNTSNNGYAEARLPGTLSRNDVKCVLNSGLNPVEWS